MSVRFLPSLVALACLASALGCRSGNSLPEPLPKTERPAGATGPAPAATLRRFGQGIAPGSSLPLSSILARPDDFVSAPVTVEAKVRRNCTRRGCWMELAEKLDPNVPGCRVTFKDYGFFVPLDSAGSSARVQGTIQVQTVTAPEVEHLEGEGAKFAAKQPDGTAREVRMIATGVELWRGPG
ncbi:MAG TPA: DUF4920 domain-containing protein [Polyangiaceae bacterium]